MDELQLTIDHLGLSVADLGRARRFYERALAPLGLDLVADASAEVTDDVVAVGFGIGRKGTFWLMGRGTPAAPTHICFRAATREAVRKFHRAALAAGARDNGSPGVRKRYHSAYYAAFVLDPEGHNIEAVCFEPESPQSSSTLPNLQAGERPGSEVVRQLWHRMEDRDWAGVEAALHAEFEAHWPQSGERFDRRRFVAVNRAYPGDWHIRLVDIVDAGDRVVTEVEVDLAGRTDRAVSIFRLREGKIVGLREYWPEPMEIPAWRAALE